MGLKMFFTTADNESITLKIDDDIIAIYQTEQNVKITMQFIGIGCDAQNPDSYILYGHVKKLFKFSEEVVEYSVKRFTNTEEWELINDDREIYTLSIGEKLKISEKGQTKDLIGLFVTGKRSFYVLEGMRSQRVNRSW